MEPGAGQSIQEKLQCIINKINREQLKNRVTDWQRKLVATASSKFSFDSSSQASAEATGPNSCGKPNTDANVEPFDGHSLKENEDDLKLLDGEAELLESDRTSELFEELGKGKMEGNEPLETKLLSPVEEVPRNKSPVQLWVDSLVDDHTSYGSVDIRINVENADFSDDGRDEEMPPIVEADQNDAEVESFSLGAEAPGVACPRPYPFVQVTAHGGSSDAGSHSSMESLLEARKPDPEEMLMDLGFGGCEEPDIISRIPDRFLRPSSMKGIAIDDFLRHQKMMAHQFQSGFSGYRGLTGPSHAMPSGIVGKIMDRLLEAEVGRQNQEDFYRAQKKSVLMNGVLQHCQASQTQGGYSPKLARLTHSLMMKMRGPKKESVLSPENRNWYENQGDKSPDPSGTRLIIGHRSYTFAKDGNLIEDPLYVANNKAHSNSVSPTRNIETGNQNCYSRKNEKKKNEGAFSSISNDYKRTCNDVKTLCRHDHVLFEVEEEDEEILKSAEERGENSEFTVTVQKKASFLSSNSSLFCNEQLASGLIQMSGLKTKLAQRRSLPDATSMLELGKTILNEAQLNELRRKSLGEELCLACGSRKTSGSEPSGPVAKRSKSPNYGVERVSVSASRSIASCDNLILLNDNNSNVAETYIEKGDTVFSREKRSASNNNDISGSESGISEPTSLHSGSSQEPNIENEKRLSTTAFIMGETHLVASGDQVGQRQSCQALNACEDMSVSDSSNPSTPSSNSFDQEEAELEYRNLVLLASQLQGSTPSVSVGTEEEFLVLNRNERRNMQIAVIEEALQTYQKKLKELDLRGHLRDLLTGQLLKVTDLLDSSSSPNVLKIMKQMTTLLRHQESLRQELDLHESRFGNHSSKPDT